MTTDTTGYKTRLEEMLAELTKELESLGIQDPENPANWIATPEGVEVGKADPNVVADQVEDWEEKHSTTETLEVRYNNIKRALEKINTGTYGLCEIGGKEITTERLVANPAARTCKLHMNDESLLPR